MSAPVLITRTAPVVKVNGTELSGGDLAALNRLTIKTGLRVPGRAVMEFVDPKFTVSGGQIPAIGNQVEIAMSDGTALFTGAVTGVDLDMDRGSPTLSVIADDPCYAMTLGNKVRTFVSMSFSDVVRSIAGDYGLALEQTATTGQQDYLLQSDSDFGFLNEIADRIGYDLWVDAGGTLQFHPATAAPAEGPTIGWKTGELRHFSVSASALHPGKVTVNSWDPGAKQGLTHSETTSTTGSTATLVDQFVTAGNLSGKNQVLTAHRSFATQSDGTGLATSVVNRWTAGAVIATGTCLMNPAIIAGKQVTVSESGPASGTYKVTEVEHTYTSRGFETRFTAGERGPTGLVDTLAGTRASSFRQDGLVIGIVTNLGSSSTPKGYVKVKFPTLGADIESAWARVVSVGAGNSRGMTFLPEINDEVIVGFESGDVTRPLVLGGLYGGQDVALDYGAANGTIAKRQIVSRLGHVIELGDGTSAADQHLWLTLAGGEHLIKLGKDALTASVPAGLPVTVSAGDTKFQIDDQGNIVLSGKKVTITATQDVEISGMNIKLKAQSSVEGSGATVKMSGTGQAELSSGGSTSVKGTVVAIN